MSQPLLFKLIQYRNSIYQGFTISSSSYPHGLGLLFDDSSTLYCSIFHNSLPSSRTVVFFSKEQYIFGDWKSGKPEGFNVFRDRDRVMLGWYKQGRIVGKRVIVFEGSNCAVVMSGEEENKKSKVLKKKFFSTDEQQKKLIKKEFDELEQVEEYMELIYFLKVSFCQKGSVQLKMEDKELRFGFDEGLGVIFNEDKMIERMGVMGRGKKIEGLGTKFGIGENQEGDFENKEIVRYKDGQRPNRNIKDIFVKHHKKSIVFKNDYIILHSTDLKTYLTTTLKTEISSIPQKQLLQIHTKTSSTFRQTLTQQQVLRLIKQQYSNKSIPKNTHLSKSPSKPVIEKKNDFHYTPLDKKYFEPQRIQWEEPRSNSKEKNRKVFLQKNHLGDYREYYGVSGGKGKTYYNYGINTSHSPKVVNTTIKTPSKSPNKSIKPTLSRQYGPSETKQKSQVIQLRKVIQIPNPNRHSPIHATHPYPSLSKRVDVSSIKFKHANSMEVSKKSEYKHSREINHEMEAIKEREREIKRLSNNRMVESIQKQLNELPPLHNETPSKSPLKSSQLRFDLKRGSPQKQTADKSDPYPSNHNYNHQQSMRESPVDRIKDQIDSVDKMKQSSKLYQSRYKRYMEDGDIASQRRDRVYAGEVNTTPKKKLSPVAVYQMVVSESKERVGKKKYVETESEKEERVYDGKRVEKKVKSRRVENEEEGESMRKPKESRAKKVIEIQRQRISPQGKKTTSYQKITKKYHYINDLEQQDK